MTQIIAITVRKPNLEDKAIDGIPRDFLKVMHMFNRKLKDGTLKHIPRTTKITRDEIRKLWLPSVKQNITYLGEEAGEILSSGTLLIVPGSNQYSLDSGRTTEYALISEQREAGLEVTRAVLQEAKAIGQKFVLHTSVDNEEEQWIMSQLGFQPTRRIEVYERFLPTGNSAVFEYTI